MNSRKMKEILEEKLKDPQRKFIYDSKNDQLRVENCKTGKGITLSLPGIVAKWETEKEKAIERTVYYVEQGLEAMSHETLLNGREKFIYPVIRSASFPKTSKEGIPLIYDEHTAETRIYYAVDEGKTYRLIDKQLLDKEGMTHEQIREVALFNVRSLSTDYKIDEVSGNTFYFINHNDGYDASRLLNDAFLKEMEKKISGEMLIGVPHQDVLIIADIQNETGYDVMAQLTMSFFMNGRVPITALSLSYKNGHFEPIFILGKRKKNN